MSCVLHAVGRVVDIKDEQDKNRILFSVISQGSGAPDETGRIPSEKTGFIVVGKQMHRFRAAIKSGDYIYVMAVKITRTHTDAEGNQTSFTVFRVLSCNEALVRIWRPINKNKTHKRKDIDKNDAFRVRGINPNQTQEEQSTTEEKADGEQAPE